MRMQIYQRKNGHVSGEKIIEAAKTLREEALEADRPAPEVRIWLVSAGGFTGEVMEYISEKYIPRIMMV